VQNVFDVPPPSLDPGPATRAGGHPSKGARFRATDWLFQFGVTVHVTAPKIDPSFQGTITLEMANFGTVPVDLRTRGAVEYP